MSNNIGLLVYIAKNAVDGEFSTTTLSLSTDFGFSQQSVSRKLIELEEDGLINRTVSPNGILISVTRIGKEYLEKLYGDLKIAVKGKVDFVKGRVLSGLGEGRYYISMKEYKDQFSKLLFEPYEGTLNLKVDPVEVQSIISGQKGVVVSGFSTAQRTFGGLVCYKVFINDVEGALIFPDRTIHGREIAEVISPFYLRQKLDIKDGDEVRLNL